MSKFYAKYAETENEVFAFNDRATRDAWVNYEDRISLEMGNNPDNTTFKRERISERRANDLIENFRMEIINTDGFLFNVDDYLVYAKPNNAKGKVKRTKYPPISFEPKIQLAERKMMASIIMQNAITIGNKCLAWVPTSLLHIQAYQRKRVMSHAAKIAENWDASKCNVLTVSYEEDQGWFNVIDGQHRSAAAKMRNEPYLVCEIFTGMNASIEARKFVDENTNKQKLSPFDTYKANLCVADEDDDALSRLDKRLAAVCAEYGIIVEKSQACGVLKSVPHCRKIINADGEDCLRFIFDVIRDSHWNEFPNGYCYTSVEAIRKVYKSNGDNLLYAKEALCRFMSQNSPFMVDAAGNSQYSNLGRTARWDAVLAQAIG